jgi:Tol biopolymer transport system component
MLAAGAPAQAADPGTVTWLSRVGLNGVGSNDSSAVFARPSADGSRVVFLTEATNLGDGASGTQTKAYLRDVRTGTNTLVANEAYDIVISGDGRWIAFSTFAVLPGFTDANGTGDTYLYEVATENLTLVSRTASSATTTGNGQSDTPSFSHDGRYLLFSSSGANLVSGVTDGGISTPSCSTGSRARRRSCRARRRRRPTGWPAA